MLPVKRVRGGVVITSTQRGSGGDDADSSVSSAADGQAPPPPAGFSPKTAGTSQPSAPLSPSVSAASTAAATVVASSAAVAAGAIEAAPSLNRRIAEPVGDGSSTTTNAPIPLSVASSSSIGLSPIARHSGLQGVITEDPSSFARPSSGAGASSSGMPDEDSRSQRGSWSDRSHEGVAGAAGYYDGGATGEARHAGMPRNFRIAVDGYTLLRDDDGTYAAYRINVTGGLFRWQVLRRYRQFLSLHQAVGEHVRAEDMPHLPGKRILGSSVHPSFAEARGLALQVYLRQLVCVRAAWRVPQLTGFLDTRASMIGVQGQISEVLDQVDRMESLCVDLQHQVDLDSGWNESKIQACKNDTALEEAKMENIYRRVF